MRRRRTLKVFGCILGAYALLLALAFKFEGLLVVAAPPFLAIYLFHAAGIPGLLEHQGHCGWGWCSPTLFGWAVLVLFWLFVVWLVAAGLVRLFGEAEGG